MRKAYKNSSEDEAYSSDEGNVSDEEVSCDACMH